MRHKIFCWVGLLTFMSASVVGAAPITIPTGLNPGDTYFLVFVTNGTRDATSSDILDYDAFVTSQAILEPTLLALGTTWKAIGSTSSVDAVTHIAVTGPVYNLAGELVATGSPALFDRTLGHAADIDTDQFGGGNLGRFVWTGTTCDGVRNNLAALGATELVVHGATFFSGCGWVELDAKLAAMSFSLYGISGPLTIPTAVPEPGTISLMLGGGGLLLLRRTRRRWRDRPATPATRSDPEFH